MDIATGEILFYENLGYQTVNIGEYLGVVQAIKYIIENNLQPVIYTDSITAITWINQKASASRKKYLPLQQADIFLKAFASIVNQMQIIHWKNDLWGEIPADFNNK